MKALGRGWQYTAYDLGNGRVLKRYNPPLTAYLVMLKDFLCWGSPLPWKIPERYRECKEAASVSLAAVRGGILEPWRMGNPFIGPNLSYEQDRLTPLIKVFEISSIEESKNIIDAFVALNKYMLDHGVIDKSFKIGLNFGLDTQGRVVLMDLGELYIDPDAIVRRRMRRPWAFPSIRKIMSNKEVRTYYVEQMDKHIGL